MTFGAMPFGDCALRGLGMAQPKLSNMLRGQFRGISEAKMLEYLTKLGRDVEIVVKPVSGSQTTGHVSVVFA